MMNKKCTVITKWILIAAVIMTSLMLFSISSQAATKGYTIANSSCPVYSNTGLTSKIGTIYSSDELTINQLTEKYAKVTYNITNSNKTKTGYIATSAIANGTSGYKFTPSKRIVTYKRPNGSSYGYFDSQDGNNVRVIGMNKSYLQVTYPAGSNIKIAWVLISDAKNGLLGSNVKYYVKNSSGIVMHTGANECSSSICTIPYNSPVYVYAYNSSNWSIVSYNGYIGFVKGNDLSSKKTVTATTYYVKTSGPNYSLIMRSSPSSSSSKITSMPYAAALSVYSITNGWANISYNGKNGYCSSSYISKTRPSVITNTIALSYGLYKKSSAYISCGFDQYVNTKGRHEGIDIQGGNGSSIYALTSGVITRVTFGKRGSNGLSTIAIYDSVNNKTVVYLHSAPSSSLRVGQNISKGQYLGTQDWRGISSSNGGHTHVEVVNGKATAAKKSVNDYTLDNSNPTSYWQSKGYIMK